MNGRNMKRIWEFTQVEIDHVIVPDEEFNHRLDEWAEIVYGYLCQLSEKQAKASQHSMPEMAGRTGTDG